ncbi:MULTISPECIES: hypothetical protein [Streptomyces]|nr:hypothetical protein [Streptomyces venezuelae]APE22879.1 hypothetical protein vnz_18965 [Streptomyces venezuelae]QES00259.1 hypothetical protein DEJ43_19230 [Streptomyces venezuelae ATCC 10712]QES13973.1 hypothetical protein DEJ45_17170 [Streptomyces venezuelae]
MFRTTRAAAAFAALAALVLGLLVCGTTTGTPRAAGPVVLGAAVPGCDPGHPADEGAAGPVVPPRAHGFAELLPALAADRAPGGVRQPYPDGPGVSPGREPPARVPLSPVELSVLRV